jgi:hypothetical protein
MEQEITEELIGRQPPESQANDVQPLTGLAIGHAASADLLPEEAARPRPGTEDTKAAAGIGV